MGEVSHFIGMKFPWQRKPDNHITVHMTQEAFANNLIDKLVLQTPILSRNHIDQAISCSRVLAYLSLILKSLFVGTLIAKSINYKVI